LKQYKTKRFCHPELVEGRHSGLRMALLSTFHF
jgi:hypothetical protein